MTSVSKYLVILFVLVQALAVSMVARASEDLLQYVNESTQELVTKLNEERGLYSENPEAFYRSMDETLQDFVDFRRIAARVMGRYARQTTPEQRDAFVEKFKRSLFDSYAQALVESQDFTIEVKEAQVNPDNDTRASVQMEVISASGNRYPVSYSMYRKDGSADWRMENVIVEGINIGLAFRDRFAQEMESSGGNIQAVIDGWSGAVEGLDSDGEVEGQ
ncbi:MlaC/ttg2D family ABC transporter substrate-binding protein [Marinobacter mobilis]|uniref:Phospholipid transport system substrate-binding protein n=1 Tax=Marinobacter mobilis TaxID=488533 RepID=A0A1H2TG12_9GAMM|nr:ABC transporter substrate-binding protein [Marinobacter mobilis]SDW42812.1 phospholipid transport system substrate-binding protein [Marinobacter mobilis]